MSEMRVKWEIDIFDAGSPVEAARKALEIQRRPESIATVFEVFDSAGVRLDTVDLTEVDSHDDDTLPAAEGDGGLRRVLVNYNQSYPTKGAIVSIILIEPDQSARWDQFRGQVKALGANEAYWNNEVRGAFIEGEWDEDQDSYTPSLVEATGLPAQFFDRLEASFQENNLDAVSYYLEEVDAEALFLRLENPRPWDAVQKSTAATVHFADGVRVTNAGEVLPIYEEQDDDGLVVSLGVRIPAATEPVDTLALSELEADSAPKP